MRDSFQRAREAYEKSSPDGDDLWPGGCKWMMATRSVIAVNEVRCIRWLDISIRNVTRGFEARGGIDNLTPLTTCPSPFARLLVSIVPGSNLLTRRPAKPASVSLHNLTNKGGSGQCKPRWHSRTMPKSGVG